MAATKETAVSITPKQEKFAQCIADGLSQADAYRTAYSAGKMSDGALHVEASKLMDNPKIALRLSELRGKLEKKALWTREMSVQALAQAYKVAQSQNNASGMTGAIKELNAMHGYNAPIQSEVYVTGALIAPDQFQTAEEWEKFTHGG